MLNLKRLVVALLFLATQGAVAQIPPTPTFDCDFTNAAAAAVTTCGVTVTRNQANNTDLRPDSAYGYAYGTYAANVPRTTAGRGLLNEESRTNYLLNSLTPATQTTGTLPTGVYVLWVNEASAGAGSATISAGSATGCLPTPSAGAPGASATATTGTWVTFVITGTGTCTVTVTGSLRAFQLETCGASTYNPCFGSSLIITTGATVTRPADLNMVVGNAAIQTVVFGSTASVYLEAENALNQSTGNQGVLLSTNTDQLFGLQASSTCLPNMTIFSKFGVNTLGNCFGAQPTTNTFTATIGATFTANSVRAAFIGTSSASTSLVVSNSTGTVRNGDAIPAGPGVPAGTVIVSGGPGGDGTYITNNATTISGTLTTSGTGGTVLNVVSVTQQNPADPTAALSIGDLISGVGVAGGGISLASQTAGIGTTGGAGVYTTSATTTIACCSVITAASTNLHISFVSAGKLVAGDGNQIFAVASQGASGQQAPGLAPGSLILTNTCGLPTGGLATFAGTGSGTTLTVPGPVTGVICPGSFVSGTVGDQGIPPGTIINSQTSGTTGKDGVYVTNVATTAAGTLETGYSIFTLSTPSSILNSFFLQPIVGGGWGNTSSTIKAALGWDGTGRCSNVNNGLIQCDANTKTAGDTTIYLGGLPNTIHIMDGYVRKFRGWSTRLSKDQLTYLTQQTTTVAVDSITSSSQVLNSGSTVPLVVPTVHQTTGQDPSPGYKTVTPPATIASLAQQVGSDAVRLEAQWQAVERSVGVYNFSGADPYALAYLAQGIKLHMLFSYGNNIYFTCGSGHFYFCNNGNQFNASSSGGNLVVTSLFGTITPNDGNPILSLVAGIPANTHITGQVSGTTGSNGTYTTDNTTTLTGTQAVAQPFPALNTAYANFAAASAAHYDAMSVAAGMGHIVTSELGNEVNCGYAVQVPSPIDYGYQMSAAAAGIKTAAGIALGGTAHAGDTLSVTFTSSAIAGSPLTVSYTAVGNLITDAAGLAAAINANSTLSGLTFKATAGSPATNIVSIYQSTPISPRASYSVAVTGGGATTTMTLAQPNYVTAAGMGQCGNGTVALYMTQMLANAPSIADVDALGNHPYQTQYPPEPVTGLVQAFNIATANVKPQANTEQGYTAYNQFQNIPQVTRAYYAARLLLMELASGTSEIAWYVLVDGGVLPNNPGYGLFTNNDLPAFLGTPSSTAFTNTKAAMAGATAWSVRYFQNSDVYLATFTNSLGTNAVVWSPNTSASFTWNAPAFSSATAKDVLGYPITPVVNGNAYTVPVGSGDPIIITGLN